MPSSPYFCINVIRFSAEVDSVLERSALARLGDAVRDQSPDVQQAADVAGSSLDAVADFDDSFEDAVNSVPDLAGRAQQDGAAFFLRINDNRFQGRPGRCCPPGGLSETRNKTCKNTGFYFLSHYPGRLGPGRFFTQDKKDNDCETGSGTAWTSTLTEVSEIWKSGRSGSALRAVNRA
eukprot:7868418-Pyramimonas_sp.AAC.1